MLLQCAMKMFAAAINVVVVVTTAIVVVIVQYATSANNISLHTNGRC